LKGRETPAEGTENSPEFGLAAHMTAMTGGGMSGARHQREHEPNPNVATFSLELN
jgi:hypothetical protein